MLSREKLIGFSILAVIAFLSALTIGYFVLFGGKGSKIPADKSPTNSLTSIEIWGIFDDSDVYEPIFAAYEKAHPNVSLRYKKFIWDDYESTLVNALASGRGPDIFMIHNTWVAKHKDKLASAGPNIQSGFINNEFIQKGITYGVPLFIDDLALFYNQDLFSQQGFSNPPQTWEQFIDYVKALTRFSSTGQLLRSGAALGTNSARINRATDILLALLLQNGIEPFDTRTNTVSWANDQKRFDAAKDALRFYTDFANPSKSIYTWNEDQDYSIDAFWEGKAAMMLNYAYNIQTIKDKAPYLNFATAPLPFKESSVRRPTIGNYWGFAVSKGSRHQEIAWDFLTFFGSDEHYDSYIKQTKRLPAKNNLLEAAAQNPLLKAFVDQALFIKTPYQPDERKMQEIFDEMIQKVNKGELTLDQVLNLGADKLKLLIR